MALYLTLTAADDEAGTVNVRSITLAVLSADWFMPREGDIKTYFGGVRGNRTARRWTCIVIYDVFGVTGTGGTIEQDRGHLQILEDDFLNAEHLWMTKTGTVLSTVGRKTGVVGTFNYFTDATHGVLSDTLSATKKVVANYSPPSRDSDHAVDNFTVTFEEEVPTYA